MKEIDFSTLATKILADFSWPALLMFLTFHMVRYNAWKTLESFRFEDGNDYEYEICIKVFFAYS